MPYTISWEPKGCVKTITGVVTAKEFMASIAELQNDLRFDKARYSINNFVDAQAFEITTADIHLYAAHSLGAAYSNRHMRIAIVATDPDIIALVQVYVKLSPYKTEFFETMEAARVWVSET